jgi:hypothetical protein
LAFLGDGWIRRVQLLDTMFSSLIRANPGVPATKMTATRSSTVLLSPGPEPTIGLQGTTIPWICVFEGVSA